MPLRQAVVVTGLSGAGKSSVLRVLEDLGHETVDNPPLAVLGELMAGPGERPLAVGVDARTRGFDATALLAGLDALRARGAVAPELVYVEASETILLRRYSETRRRHPLAPAGLPGSGVADGIAREAAALAPLREAADWLIDTSGLPLPELRRMIERRYGIAGTAGMSVTVQSFGYPRGLPREADLVLDMRFLRNPHYDPALRPMTGRDTPVADYIKADAEWAPFWARMTALLDPLLPAYQTGGKKYLTVALGCTGGKHRSVFAAECLARHLSRGGWPVELTHRELAVRESLPGTGTLTTRLQAAPAASHIDAKIMNDRSPAAPRAAPASPLSSPKPANAVLPDHR
ncbi:RNase adapter RapZ [Roseomonas xinghualingensis]|uniref:RNase adapter RapZ n=1 Tax=Roseomonas xinghualingensis TaxID=2986475 RepID=UPI0021F1C9ED|nr:RNase adapter RapZ [Roseomonas sp. SXEYE001]MCV4208845.1 RNase adapter RapZ [Roseomonas sp. SXEYE001]